MIRRIICRLFGHKWSAHADSDELIENFWPTNADYFYCLRCAETRFVRKGDTP